MLSEPLSASNETALSPKSKYILVNSLDLSACPKKFTPFLRITGGNAPKSNQTTDS